MDAIELLEMQHRDVERLFSQLEGSSGEAKLRHFRALGDLLSLHALIEENHFYPVVKTADTEDLVLESLEEHLAIKRLLADLLKMSIRDEQFEAKLTVLQEQFMEHLKEEREELFPQVRRLLDPEQLEAVGQIMTATIVEQEDKAPRLDVPLQTAETPPLKTPEQAMKPVGILERLLLPMFIGAKAVKNVVKGARDLFRGNQRRRPRTA
jgi:hemerythrin superfamily protein